MLCDIKIKKHNFQYSEHPIDISNKNIDKKLISSKVSFDKNVLNTLLVTKVNIRLSLFVQYF